MSASYRLAQWTIGQRALKIVFCRRSVTRQILRSMVFPYCFDLKEDGTLVAGHAYVFHFSSKVEHTLKQHLQGL
jgi:hypothetical protein